MFPQVILGLLCPAYIPQLEFKSREELQLMPQTEEEHQLGLEEEEEESVEGGLAGKRTVDGQHHRNTEPDIEVGPGNGGGGAASPFEPTYRLVAYLCV